MSEDTRRKSENQGIRMQGIRETGDQVIVKVVSVFKKYFRKDDIIARYGGDEFIIVITNSSISKVKKRVMFISKEIDNLEIKSKSNNKLVKITISAGIGNFPKHTNDLEQLKEITDKALYQAKTSGKNKIICVSKK